MDLIVQQLLKCSSHLYETLSTFPEDSEREAFIVEVNKQLDERGLLIEKLKRDNFVYNSEDNVHKILFELDKGIKERLNKQLSTIKHDLKELQASKKSEQQYNNPYSHLQSMDGMYYDRKK